MLTRSIRMLSRYVRLLSKSAAVTAPDAAPPPVPEPPPVAVEPILPIPEPPPLPVPEPVAQVVPEPKPEPFENEPFYTRVFDYDGLRTHPNVIHNHDFMRDPRFIAAMKCGNTAQGLDTNPDPDLRPAYWRLHVGTWCAAHAVKLGGDFVECGVWKGFLSAAIMRYLDWNKLGRRFFLFDTFCGLDENLLTDVERANEHVLAHYRKHYTENYQQVVDTFREFQDVHVIRGSVPETLTTVDIERVSYLSLDMNNVTPEIAAANYFWDRIVPGGMILLDDYGFVSYEQQKAGFDRFAREKGVEILALPTGQGLILKP